MQTQSRGQKYDIKLYTLVIHSLVHNAESFIILSTELVKNYVG